MSDPLARLKHAYARGARIQERDTFTGCWVPVLDPGFYADVEYRIHPSDAHLEYGPLSSVLRDLALYGEFGSPDSRVEKDVM